MKKQTGCFRSYATAPETPILLVVLWSKNFEERTYQRTTLGTIRNKKVEQNTRNLEGKTEQFTVLYSQQLSDDNIRVFDLLLSRFY
jgi:hypothetical protein